MPTEDEARKLWCPMARYARGNDPPAYNRCDFDDEVVESPGSCRCIASKCAMWRWDYKQIIPGPNGDVKVMVGFCGLAGRPK
jgi:hypothetical protein